MKFVAYTYDFEVDELLQQIESREIFALGVSNRDKNDYGGQICEELSLEDSVLLAIVLMKTAEEYELDNLLVRCDSLEQVRTLQRACIGRPPGESIIRTILFTITSIREWQKIEGQLKPLMLIVMA